MKKERRRQKRQQAAKKREQEELEGNNKNIINGGVQTLQNAWVSIYGEPWLACMQKSPISFLTTDISCKTGDVCTQGSDPRDNTYSQDIHAYIYCI